MNAITKTPSPFAVERAMSAAKPVLDALRDEADPELLRDVLDGETDVLDVVRALIRVSMEAEAYEEACNIRIRALAERQTRYAKRYDTARATAFAMLEELGIDKIEEPDFTVSKRAGKPGVVITDESALPAECVRIERKPNKSEIALALAVGPVPGAEWSNARPVWAVKKT